MNNEPVAWWDGKEPSVLGLSYFKNDYCPIPLYTHPAKTLTEIDYVDFLPIWKDFIKDANSVLNAQMIAHHFYNIALRRAQEK